MRYWRKPRPAWTEGIVNQRDTHARISYGESLRAVALVGQTKRGFRVQFLLKARPGDQTGHRILETVRQELTFYLHDVVGPDAWPFVEFHCDTPANRRSAVRWSWHPRPSAGGEA
jgi:hypothetical protein